MKENNIGIFEEVKEFPEPAAARRYAALVGLDDIKDRLLKEARLLLDPDSLAAWSMSIMAARRQLLIFSAIALRSSSLREMLELARPRWQKHSGIPWRANRISGLRCMRLASRRAVRARWAK